MHKPVTMGSLTRPDSGANHLEGKPGINIPNPIYIPISYGFVSTNWC